MPHPSEHADPRRPLELAEAEELAEAMRAFGAASRLRLLWAMLDGERRVEELAVAAGLTQSATSHQLRLLRQGRLVAVRRAGQHAYYRLHDHHVADLLAAIRHHHEHVHPASSPAIPAEASGGASGGERAAATPGRTNDGQPIPATIRAAGADGDEAPAPESAADRASAR